MKKVLWLIERVKTGLWSLDFSMGDAQLSGRPGEVDGDRIKTLTENNRSYIMHDIADILKISKSIKLMAKMKNVSFIYTEKNHMDFLANPVEYT